MLLDTTVQTVPMGNEYGYEVSIEFETINGGRSAAGVTVALAQVSPKTGMQDIEDPMNWAVASRGTDNVLNHPMGHV
jgi:hypothetical protein